MTLRSRSLCIVGNDKRVAQTYLTFSERLGLHPRSIRLCGSHIEIDNEFKAAFTL